MSWQARAACGGLAAQLFFGPDGIDDDYYPAIDLEALRTAYKRLTWTIGNPGHPD